MEGLILTPPRTSPADAVRGVEISPNPNATRARVPSSVARPWILPTRWPVTCPWNSPFGLLSSPVIGCENSASTAMGLSCSGHLVTFPVTCSVSQFACCCDVSPRELSGGICTNEGYLACSAAAIDATSAKQLSNCFGCGGAVGF